jgi:biotin carboxyl carrier protein
VIFQATVSGRSARVEVKPREGGYLVTIDGRPLPIDVESTGPNTLHLLIEGRGFDVGLARQPTGYQVELPSGSWQVQLAPASSGRTAPTGKAGTSPVRVTAPMPGRVVRVMVKAGERVAAGAGLVVVEAMKMENELRAPRDGRVQKLEVQEGQTVEAGTLLTVLE